MLNKKGMGLSQAEDNKPSAFWEATQKDGEPT